MQCLDDHHTYHLNNFEDISNVQPLTFICKEPIEGSDGKMRTIQDGTTNEEVLEMLIHRLNGLNTKFPCRENAIAITHCEIALLFLEKRTRDRQKRGVEGQHKP